MSGIVRMYSLQIMPFRRKVLQNQGPPIILLYMLLLSNGFCRLLVFWSTRPDLWQVGVFCKKGKNLEVGVDSSGFLVRISLTTMTWPSLLLSRFLNKFSRFNQSIEMPSSCAGWCVADDSDQYGPFRKKKHINVRTKWTGLVSLIPLLLVLRFAVVIAIAVVVRSWSCGIHYIP